MRVRVHNPFRQAHAALFKNEMGVLGTRFVPGRSFVEVDSDSLSQDVYDKVRHGTFRLRQVEEKKVEKAQPAPLPKQDRAPAKRLEQPPAKAGVASR